MFKKVAANKTLKRSNINLTCRLTTNKNAVLLKIPMAMSLVRFICNKTTYRFYIKAPTSIHITTSCLKMPPKRRGPIAQSTSKHPRGKFSLNWLPKPPPAQSFASQSTFSPRSINTSLITTEALQANGIISNGQENDGLGVNL